MSGLGGNPFNPSAAQSCGLNFALKDGNLAPLGSNIAYRSTRARATRRPLDRLGPNGSILTVARPRCVWLPRADRIPHRNASRTLIN
jgi:hypothetical protein